MFLHPRCCVRVTDTPTHNHQVDYKFALVVHIENKFHAGLGFPWKRRVPDDSAKHGLQI